MFGLAWCNQWLQELVPAVQVYAYTQYALNHAVGVAMHGNPARARHDAVSWSLCAKRSSCQANQV